MKHTESTGISRRRLLAVASVSAGAALFGQRPLFAEKGRNVPAVADTTASTKNTSIGHSSRSTPAS
jgi:hypothetical protein